MNDDASGRTDDNTTERKTEPVVDSTKERKNAQLAAARESAKNKKRQREDDLNTMKSQLDKLTSLLETKTEPEQTPDSPPQKRKRVTIDPEESINESTQPTEDNSWMTSAVRTGALVGLAGASFYFQNMYGKGQATKKKPKGTTKTISSVLTTTMPALSNPTQVGSSGFVL
jgi:hypothetical protein